MSKYLGDFSPSKTVRFYFNTHDSTGASVTLADSPAITVYKDDGTDQSDTGVTLTVDFDLGTASPGLVGLHLVEIDTSADGTFYSAGSDFSVVLTSGTVDGISVVPRALRSFSINNRSPLRPTVADRTLDVTATGEAGIDFANIGSPTTMVNLSGTTIATTQKVDVETIKTQAVVCGAGVTIGAYVGNATAAIAVNGSGYVTYANAAPPSAADVVTALGTGSTLTACLTATGFSTHSAADVAALVLATPANKLATDTSGYVTFANASIATVTDLTNLPAITTDWLTADGVKADAVTKIQTGLSTYDGSDTSGTTTLLSRVVGTIATGTHYPQSGDTYAFNKSITLVGVVNAVTNNGQFSLTSTDLSTNDSDYVGMWLVFTAGNNKGILRRIGAYTGSTKTVQFTGSGLLGAFPQTVQADDSWQILAGSP